MTDRRRVAWEATIEVLRETDNPAVMFGDSGLLHAIAERLGWEAMGVQTEDRVMAAWNKSPGRLIKSKSQLGNGRIVSKFSLPKE